MNLTIPAGPRRRARRALVAAAVTAGALASSALATPGAAPTCSSTRSTDRTEPTRAPVASATRAASCPEPHHAPSGTACATRGSTKLWVQLEAEFKSSPATTRDAKMWKTIGEKRPQFADIDATSSDHENPLNRRTFAAAREILLHD